GVTQQAGHVVEQDVGLAPAEVPGDRGLAPAQLPVALPDLLRPHRRRDLLEAGHQAGEPPLGVMEYRRPGQHGPGEVVIVREPPRGLAGVQQQERYPVPVQRELEEAGSLRRQAPGRQIGREIGRVLGGGQHDQIDPRVLVGELGHRGSRQDDLQPRPARREQGVLRQRAGDQAAGVRQEFPLQPAHKASLLRDVATLVSPGPGRPLPVGAPSPARRRQALDWLPGDMLPWARLGSSRPPFPAGRPVVSTARARPGRSRCSAPLARPPRIRSRWLFRGRGRGGVTTGMAGSDALHWWAHPVGGKSLGTWIAFLAILLSLLAFDLVILGRLWRERPPTARESLTLAGFFIGAALLYGAWVWLRFGSQA